MIALLMLIASFDNRLFEMHDPKEILGIEETVETYVEPEPIFRKCLEGSEIIALKQKRTVEVEPGVEIWMERSCQGHEEEIEDPQKQQIWFDHKSTAQKLRREAEARLKKDPEIKHVESWIDGDEPYRAKVKYWHKENSDACPLCQYKESGKPDGQWQKKHVRRCLGHREPGSADTHTYEKAKKNQRGQEATLKRDLSLAASKVYLGQHRSDGKFRLDKELRHKDGAPGCNQFVTDEVWFIPPKEKSDTWAAADPKMAEDYEKKGRCRLVWIKNLLKPETRVINGLAVQRDFWERELILDCQIDSKCGEMRREGCEFIGEECAAKDEIGRCIATEKTYDCGKVPGYTKVSRTFKQAKIWGLNGEFDEYKKNYDRRSDFPVMASALTSVMGLVAEGQEISPESLENPDLPLFYQGTPYTCHCSFQKDPFDCCEKSSTDPRCTKGELELVRLKSLGRCRYIGPKVDEEGNTEHVHCCFGMKIARIVQEQLRGKLSLGWGSPEEPDCRGLTQTEMEKIPLQEIDLSETYDDYHPDGEEMMKKIEGKVLRYLNRSEK